MSAASIEHSRPEGLRGMICAGQTPANEIEEHRTAPRTSAGPRRLNSHPSIQVSMLQLGETCLAIAHGDRLPALNMAWDETLLTLAGTLGHPILRTYGWSAPAATFGYFQRWREVSTWTTLRPLIRRPTGGGLVPHENDWTYALAFPTGHPWHGARAAASYEHLHAWLRDALARLDIATELAPAAQADGPGRCFLGAERHDLLHQGRKIAGAAQRRTRAGLLIQGSVQPAPAGIPRALWHAALLAAAEERWQVRWESPSPDADLFRQAAREAETLAARKYDTRAHNQRR